MKLATSASIATVVALVTVLAGATSASANTPPNAYAPAGAAWLDVPASERVYLESFGLFADDSAIYSVPAGVSCTANSISADGPFFTFLDLDETECVDAGLNPIDPIDDGTRLGAFGLGFGINFFGTTYTNAWPSTNGGLHFTHRDADYDASLVGLSYYSDGNAMFPLTTDQFYDNSQSNFWAATTTVDGRAAVVFSWERFHNCCTIGASPEDMTYQLVLIEVGAGDFNAQFNYSSMAGMAEGYSGPTAVIDMATGVAPGTNIVVADNVLGIAPGCTEAWGDDYGTSTDAVFGDALNGPELLYYDLVDATARTLSLWSDMACTVPITSSVVQDIPTDGYAYVELTDNNAPVNLLSAGWGSYNQSTGQITTTEFFRNINYSTLQNGQPGALNQRSLNSTVPGQFIIGQRGGVTVTDGALLGLAAAPGLAATGIGVDPRLLGALVIALLLAGAATIVYTRRSRTV